MIYIYSLTYYIKVACTPNCLVNNAYWCDWHCGTGGAAPAVSGAAASFKDWYLHLSTTANEVPRLIVNMLNLGDRRNETSSGLDMFSNLYGSGGLRLRYFHFAGMDSAWRWVTNCVTMTSGQTYSTYMGPSSNPQDPIYSDVELMKVAIWWFEGNTGAGQQKAYFSSNVCKINPPFITCDTHYSDGDNKIQYIYDDICPFPTPATYKLEIYADFIPSGKTRRVCYTFFWEDLDRDDSNGPCHSCPQDDPEYLFYR